MQKPVPNTKPSSEPKSAKASDSSTTAPKGFTEVKGKRRIFVGGLPGKPHKGSRPE